MKKIDLNEVQIEELLFSKIDEVLKIETDLSLNVHSKNNIIKELNNKNFKIFVANYKDKLIGFCSFSYILDIEIEAIAVKKDFQNLGIGTLLLNKIINFSKSHKIKNIFLEVRKSNTLAQKLYLKHNFKYITIRKNYYTLPIEDAIILKKEIST